MRGSTDCAARLSVRNLRAVNPVLKAKRYRPLPALARSGVLGPFSSTKSTHRPSSVEPRVVLLSGIVAVAASKDDSLRTCGIRRALCCTRDQGCQAAIVLQVGE